MVAIKKVLNSSSNVGIVTLETYCFVSYFGVESDLRSEERRVGKEC